MLFTIAQYHGKWAVLDTKARVYYFIGHGRQFCEDKARELNEYCEAKARAEKAAKS